MKRNTFAGLAILALPALASCDPHTCGTDFIENHSSTTVYLHDMDSVIIDSLTAGQSKSVGPVCGLGRGTSPEVIVGYRLVTNGDTACKKNIQDPKDWNTIKIEKYKWEHHFPVTDADF